MQLFSQGQGTSSQNKGASSKGAAIRDQCYPFGDDLKEQGGAQPLEGSDSSVGRAGH